MGLSLLVALTTAHCTALHRVWMHSCWDSSQMKAYKGGRIQIGCTTAVSMGQVGGNAGEEVDKWQWRASGELTFISQRVRQDGPKRALH